jgi:hypothetical protein
LILEARLAEGAILKCILDGKYIYISNLTLLPA